MCNYCENFVKHQEGTHGAYHVLTRKMFNRDAVKLRAKGYTNAAIAEKLGVSEASLEKGFSLAMIRSEEHYRIKQSQLVYDKECETPITYLKAVQYDKEKYPEGGQHIAVQIHYCPFCGEKLD